MIAIVFNLIKLIRFSASMWLMAVSMLTWCHQYSFVIVSVKYCDNCHMHLNERGNIDRRLSRDMLGISLSHVGSMLQKRVSYYSHVISQSIGDLTS